jgi:CSLREA domain-containing protein
LCFLYSKFQSNVYRYQQLKKLWKKVRFPMVKLLYFCLGMISLVANAEDIHVNTVNDTSANDGFCSLREAIESANTNDVVWPSIGECVAGDGADIVHLPEGNFLVDNHSNLPFVTENLSIQGVSSDTTVIDANFTNDSFTGGLLTVNISGVGDFTLSDLAIVNTWKGKIAMNLISRRDTPQFQDQDTFKIIRCKFSGHGGSRVIAATAATKLSIVNSTFDDNHMSSDIGGMISVSNGANVFIQSSTFSNNSATQGGAIHIKGALFNGLGVITSVHLLASTFNANSSEAHGGAIYADEFSFLSAINSTISGNIADSNENDVGNGGGIYVSNNASALLKSTILAGNQDQSPSPLLRHADLSLNNNSVLVQTGGFNFLGSTAGTLGRFPLSPNISTPNEFNDIAGFSLAPFDPLLMPLADNGGRTLTMLPILSEMQRSPVIDLGVCISGFTFDQRLDINLEESFPETAVFDLVDTGTQGPRACDAGAVELKPEDVDFSISDLDSFCFPIVGSNNKALLTCL